MHPGLNSAARAACWRPSAAFPTPAATAATAAAAAAVNSNATANPAAAAKLTSSCIAVDFASCSSSHLSLITLSQKSCGPLLPIRRRAGAKGAPPAAAGAAAGAAVASSFLPPSAPSSSSSLLFSHPSALPCSRQCGSGARCAAGRACWGGGGGGAAAASAAAAATSSPSVAVATTTSSPTRRHPPTSSSCSPCYSWFPFSTRSKQKPSCTVSARATSSLASPASSPAGQSPLVGVAPADLPTVSVVIPVLNEVHSIAILVEKVGDVLTRAGWPHEIICVDDGSTDGTTMLLKCMAAEKPEMRVVVLRRNFGQTAAMAAGFDCAAGDLVVTLDADLQNDPADIPRLLSRLVFGRLASSSSSSASASAFPSSAMVPPGAGGVRGQSEEEGEAEAWGWGAEREDGGYDMVCGWRRDRKDSVVTRNLPSVVANTLIGTVTGVRLHDYGCSLKAYRMSLVRCFRLYGELHRFLPALAAMEGASICEIPVVHHPRRTGESKYGLSRIPRVLLDLAVVCFLRRYRDRPMHFFGPLAVLPLLAAATFFVLFCSALATTGPAYGLSMALSVGMPHLVACMEFLVASLLMFSLGLVADLCMRTYHESQGRPAYQVREVAL